MLKRWKMSVLSKNKLKRITRRTYGFLLNVTNLLCNDNLQRNVTKPSVQYPCVVCNILRETSQHLVFNINFLIKSSLTDCSKAVLDEIPGFLGLLDLLDILGAMVTLSTSCRLQVVSAGAKTPANSSHTQHWMPS